MSLGTELDRLWRLVRRDPEHLFEYMRHAFRLLPYEATEEAVRDLLTDPVCPSEQVLREFVAADRDMRQEARRVIGARPGQVVMHLNGDPGDNRPENLRIVDATENARRGRR